MSTTLQSVQGKVCANEHIVHSKVIQKQRIKKSYPKYELSAQASKLLSLKCGKLRKLIFFLNKGNPILIENIAGKEHIFKYACPP